MIPTARGGMIPVLCGGKKLVVSTWKSRQNIFIAVCRAIIQLKKYSSLCRFLIVGIKFRKPVTKYNTIHACFAIIVVV